MSQASSNKDASCDVTESRHAGPASNVEGQLSALTAPRSRRGKRRSTTGRIMDALRLVSASLALSTSF
ncbi:hypothetical protein NKR19_g5862 [Coniochaeta hoffmannii]|uniref:Uncharacterized protein n=1 Tax=Coniochaeta hoffmannii TaxID=91930 RepID=A0AA38VK61_9PEZI|nr:hypothetical protein NKR19_g5862 [Coniochaeta hoffmannii]